MKKAGRAETPAWMAGIAFEQKVQSLELISLRFPEIASSRLISDLRALGSERNSLAHGHFDQNPVDARYVVVTRKRKRRDMPVERIRVTKQAEKANNQLRRFEAFYWFEEP
jgi:hypothetical protein